MLIACPVPCGCAKDSGCRMYEIRGGGGLKYGYCMAQFRFYTKIKVFKVLNTVVTPMTVLHGMRIKHGWWRKKCVPKFSWFCSLVACLLSEGLEMGSKLFHVMKLKCNTRHAAMSIKFSRDNRKAYFNVQVYRHGGGFRDKPPSFFYHCSVITVNKLV